VHREPENTPAYFATTRWSIVIAARGNDSPESHAALSWLCEHYWFPLYTFARSRGADPTEAQDLVQGFFEHILSTGFLDSASAGRCQFRAFLLASFQNWTTSERLRQNRQKRGGGAPHLSIESNAELRFQREFADPRTPEHDYDRAWALTLIERVMAALREECEAGERGGRFEMLKPYLVGDRGDTPVDSVAARLDMTASAVRVTLHRLRARFRDLLTAEIRQTVEKDEDVRPELVYLFSALGR
jgi:DNA-directed RNA polymerase specialized sigma24 family protein